MDISARSRRVISNSHPEVSSLADTTQAAAGVSIACRVPGETGPDGGRIDRALSDGQAHQSSTRDRFTKG